MVLETGTTTFNLPDLRGKVPVGQNSNDIDFSAVGTSLGEKTHTLTIAEMPSHEHNIIDAGNGAVRPLGYGESTQHTGIVRTDANVNWTDHVFKASETGSGQAHNNMQPSLIVCYIIKYGYTSSVIQDNIKGKVIYESEDGSNSTITLDESVANAKFIEIYYKDMSGMRGFTKIESPNNKVAVLSLSTTDTNESTVWTKTKTIYINNTSISVDCAAQSAVYSNSVGTDAVDYLYILKVIAYYDNTSPEVITKREIATAVLSQEVTMTTGTIPLDLIENTTTNRLTLSNNGIRIGSGVHNVLVSANVFANAQNETGYTWTYIKRNNSVASIALVNNRGFFASTAHTPRLLDVQEGDIITIYKQDDSQSLIRTYANTYLTVEIID